MKRLTFTVALLVSGIFVLLSRTSPAVTAVRRAQPTYAVNCRLIRVTDDGRDNVQSVPDLRQADGGEISWFQGRELLITMGDAQHAIPMGEQVRMRVHELEDGRFRVFVNVSRSALEGQAASLNRSGDLIVSESSVHQIQTVRAGERLTISLDNQMKLELVVTPCGMSKSLPRTAAGHDEAHLVIVVKFPCSAYVG